MRVLVTGGAGYIGAHVVRLLQERGDTVVVADDLVSGNAERIPGTPLIEGDLASDGAVDRVADAMAKHNIDSVIHLAARKQVGESVLRPAWYYQQNVASLANVLMSMEKASVNRIVVSSTAAVYEPVPVPVAEDDATGPINPYGETKLVGEWLVRAASEANGLHAASLRYFNVAGAGWPELGDTAVTNLIPMVFEKLDWGMAPEIFGDDYDTPDGTCIRDYVHVLDLAQAHLATLDHLDDLGSGHHVFNVGTGTGYSVRQMVDAILAVSGSTVTPRVVARRPGDPASVVAAVDLIRERLGWTAGLGLDHIIVSAWESHEFFAGR